MLPLLNRDLLVSRHLLLQAAQNQLPFLSYNLLSIENPTNPQINLPPSTFFSFSSSSNSPLESSNTKEPIRDILHSYGFNDVQIKWFIHKCPSVRSTETIKPKIEHLLTFGFSHYEVIRVISFLPNQNISRLNELIASNLSLLEAKLGSKTHVIKAVVNGPFLMMCKLHMLVLPNLNLLRENNIPIDNITFLFTTYPLVLSTPPNLIIEAITKLEELSMSPSTVEFIHGLNAMTTMKKERRESRMKLYQSFGWSEQDALIAFSREPMCVQLSEEKIKKRMQFFKEELHLVSSMVLRHPKVLAYNLEKWVIPCCAILSVLAKNGLWNGEPILYYVLTMREKNFEERFVEKYGKEVPQVIDDAYQGKVEFLGFEKKY